MARTRLSCLARNGRQLRGRKPWTRRCGSGGRGGAVLRRDQPITEAVRSGRRTQRDDGRDGDCRHFPAGPGSPSVSASHHGRLKLYVPPPPRPSSTMLPPRMVGPAGLRESRGLSSTQAGAPAPRRDQVNALRPISGRTRTSGLHDGIPALTATIRCGRRPDQAGRPPPCPPAARTPSRPRRSPPSRRRRSATLRTA